jgi:hypothetical protein
VTARARTDCYLAEVRIRVQAGADLSWIRQSLDAACRRLSATSSSLKILSAVHIPDDSRLSCVVTASSRQLVQRLFDIALLPSARVLEVEVLLACIPEMDHC